MSEDAMTGWMSFFLVFLLLICCVSALIAAIAFLITHYWPPRDANSSVSGTRSHVPGVYQEGERFFGDKQTETPWWFAPAEGVGALAVVPILLSAALFRVVLDVFLRRGGVECEGRPGSTLDSAKAAVCLLAAAGCLVLIALSLFEIATGNFGFLVLLGLAALLGTACAIQGLEILRARSGRHA